MIKRISDLRSHVIIIIGFSQDFADQKSPLDKYTKNVNKFHRIYDSLGLYQISVMTRPRRNPRAHTKKRKKKMLKITLRAISDLLNVLRLGNGEREKTHQHTAREKELRTSQIVA